LHTAVFAVIFKSTELCERVERLASGFACLCQSEKASKGIVTDEVISFLENQRRQELTITPGLDSQSRFFFDCDEEFLNHVIKCTNCVSK
jgi:hypothetical protein